MHLDAALMQVSPPDEHGYCSLGLNVDVSLSAVTNAKRVIAMVNPRMPRTHGEGFIHVSRLHDIVEIDQPILEHHVGNMSQIELDVGKASPYLSF